MVFAQVRLLYKHICIYIHIYVYVCTYTLQGTGSHVDLRTAEARAINLFTNKPQAIGSHTHLRMNELQVIGPHAKRVSIVFRELKLNHQKVLPPYRVRWSSKSN